MKLKILKIISKLLLCILYQFTFITSVNGAENKIAKNNKGNSYISQKKTDVKKSVYVPKHVFEKSKSIDDILPKVSEEEINSSPTLTEKLNNVNNNKEFKTTLICQIILVSSLMLVLYLIYYNKKIPINYEPHVRSKYHIKKKRFNFYKF